MTLCSEKKWSPLDLAGWGRWACGLQTAVSWEDFPVSKSMPKAQTPVDGKAIDFSWYNSTVFVQCLSEPQNQCLILFLFCFGFCLFVLRGKAGPTKAKNSIFFVQWLLRLRHSWPSIKHIDSSTHIEWTSTVCRCGPWRAWMNTYCVSLWAVWVWWFLRQ